MKSGLLILRPEPGASETAAKARLIGLDAVVAPLFDIAPLAWEPPSPSSVEAVMLTSANAARHAGPGLSAFLHLPCFAVGEACARAAREIGFGEPVIGPADGEALLALMRAHGVSRALHPCGRDHVALHHPQVRLLDRPVYAAEAVPALPAAARAALEGGALVLLHSPRAAAAFARLCPLDRGNIRLAAISQNAADAAGPSWKSVQVADRPRDEALLELAAKLCQTEAEW